ncbi:MAG: hypothetical protein A2651_01420 [Candidatus Yanofskybacteria bacterium RIFCSPHIGHO2_01_FULL_42_12]|uniref:Nudix hydrolase domain-containing protein n=1 Tax=Candidatus Yanofskybacteria bacterium RIFCSPLOWO2_01_FULL_42_49 TaxID=1802694 RepID=A0A1F8GA19_9BACT|nr:MAG: hypothetical protein A2651_01420 [Candidatus Yanofskybacteria bacterium RIFCSPHIGHO2_01_FULL_42_12]OGN22131.1 MAG: hypothetical protein A2918_03155 [Candidatus Yanofskybacteria bacterium RIFCSPLOWO2_01_FULL_42_49]
MAVNFKNKESVLEVKPWEKVGEPNTIIQIHDKRIVMRKFKNPRTNKVEEFYQFGTTPYACIILPLNTDNEVLAVKQFRHGADKILLELPGGNPKTPEQTPEEVAEEELFEESLGHRAEKIIKLNSEPLWFNPATFITPFHAFLALGCRQTEESFKLDQGEYLELTKIPLKKWLAMCTSGKIVDAKSMAVTFLALDNIGLKIT